MPGRNLRILVIDDDRVLCQIISEVLRVRGFDAHSVLSGDEALAWTEKNPVDILLIDVMMHPITGPELAQKILKIRPGIKVVYMSGHSLEFIRHNISTEFQHEFLIKPILEDELIKKIEQVLTVLKHA